MFTSYYEGKGRRQRGMKDCGIWDGLGTSREANCLFVLVAKQFEIEQAPFAYRRALDGPRHTQHTTHALLTSPGPGPETSYRDSSSTSREGLCAKRAMAATL